MSGVYDVQTRLFKQDGTKGYEKKVQDLEKGEESCHVLQKTEDAQHERELTEGHDSQIPERKPVIRAFKLVDGIQQYTYGYESVKRRKETKRRALTGRVIRQNRSHRAHMEDMRLKSEAVQAVGRILGVGVW